MPGKILRGVTRLSYEIPKSAQVVGCPIEHYRVDAIPNPGVKTLSLLLKPHLTSWTIVSPPFYSWLSCLRVYHNKPVIAAVLICKSSNSLKEVEVPAQQTFAKQAITKQLFVKRVLPGVETRWREPFLGRYGFDDRFWKTVLAWIRRWRWQPRFCYTQRLWQPSQYSQSLNVRWQWTSTALIFKLKIQVLMSLIKSNNIPAKVIFIRSFHLS